MLGVIVTLILGSVVTGFLSFIAMFKPWSRLWLTTPNRAAVVCVASVAVFFLTLGLAPVLDPLSPEEQAAAERRERQDQQGQAQAENLRERQERADSARASTVVVCESEMSTRLRAPGTADYPFGHAGNVEALGNDRYRLRSYVDAENAFGGEVRTTFVCVVEGIGRDLSSYRLVEFTSQ